MESRYNAVLWSNWGPSLSNVTLIGNSFSKYDNTMILEEKRNHPSNCVMEEGGNLRIRLSNQEKHTSTESITGSNTSIGLEILSCE